MKPKKRTLIMIQRLLILIGLLILFSQSSRGQSPVFRYLNHEDNLTENQYNYFFFTDSYGFIWISSLNGVNRFDGLKIKSYLPEINQKKGMIGTMIQSPFFEDRDSNIWVATYHGINKYDRKRDEFEGFQIQEGNKLIRDGYDLIYLDSINGKIWFKIENTIYCSNIESINNYEVIAQNIPGNQFSVFTNDSGEVIKIISLDGLKHSGFDIINKDSTWCTQSYFFENHALPNTIHDAIFHNQNQVWLGLETGLFLFDLSSTTIRKEPAISDCSSDLIQSVSAIPEQKLLLSSINCGIWELDTLNKSQRIITDKLPKDRTPKGVYLDNKETLWLSFEDGIGFTNYFNGSFNINGNGLGRYSGKCSQLIEDKFGNIWSGFDNRGISVFNRTGELVKDFSIHEIDNIDTFYNIKDLTIDALNQVWCLSLNGLYLFNEEEWINIYSNKKKNFCSLFVHSSGLKLLITDKGVLELREDKKEYILRENKALKRFKDFEFFNFFELKNGDILIPYASKELWIGRIINGELKVSEEKKLAFESIVYDVFYEEDKTILGTSNGLIELTADLKLKKRLRKGLDYRPNSVFGIEKDSKNKYWLSTEKGLWKYDWATEDLLQFSKEDGLASSNFSLDAHLKAQNGKMWFANAEEVIHFDPNTIKPYPYLPKVYIEQLFINGAPYEDSIVINELDKIILNHNQNSLRFEVVSVGHYLPEKNKIIYKLEGYDEDWNSPIDNGHQISYPKLPSGDYLLRLKSQNANGLKSKEKVPLKIQITPPIYQQIWFQILSFILLLLLGYGLVRLYINYKLREQHILLARQKAREEERNRIADELHDDMGAGLSIIQFLSEDALDEETDDWKKGQLGKIAKSSRELLEKMSEIIWALDNQNDSLENLVQRIRDYAHDYLKTNRLGLDLVLPTHIPNIEISGGKRRNIFLILKESLHNIVKHAAGSQVKIKVETNGTYMKLYIKDNGKGISQKRIGGKGLNSMENRAKLVGGAFEIQSEEGWGTEIRLKIPYSSPYSFRIFKL